MKLGYFLAAVVFADGHMGHYEGDGEVSSDWHFNSCKLQLVTAVAQCGLNGRVQDVCKLPTDLANREASDLACCGEDDGCALATLEEPVPEGKVHCDLFPNHGVANETTGYAGREY